MKTRIISTTFAAALMTTATFAQDAAPAAESSGPSFTLSGEAEFDVYTGDILNDDKFSHSYASTLDLNVDVKFNEKWSAYVGLEADGDGTAPTAYFNGAYIQYTKTENFIIKAGDLTFSEGAFLNYYGYDDPADNAAGMVEHDIRGLEVDYSGLVVGLGFAAGDNDNVYCTGEDDDEVCVGVAYDAHVAYELGLGEHVIRPYVDYKSYQEAKHNELHAGVDASLKFGGVGLHAVYGLHMDAITEDNPGATHAILAEPSFEAGKFSVKGSAFYALFDDKAPIDHGSEIPEYMFFYVEPSMGILESLTLGVPLEYHTNSTDSDAKLESFAAGVRLYFSPVSGLDVTGFAMLNKPLGKDYGDADDIGMFLGAETVFAF